MSEVTMMPRESKNVWWERTLYAFMIAAIMIALLILTSLVFDAVLNPISIRATDRDAPTVQPMAVCPDQPQVLHLHVSVLRSMLLYIYLTVLDETESYNIDNTQVSFPPRQQPKPTHFDLNLPWTVPDLPPGTYRISVYFRGDIDSQKSARFSKRFRIGENCE